jgi:hypothetical protein
MASHDGETRRNTNTARGECGRDGRAPQWQNVMWATKTRIAWARDAWFSYMSKLRPVFL